MTPSRFSLFIAAPVVLIGALALGLGVQLHLTRLDDTTRAIDESRLRFTLGELRTGFEARMALGLPLKGMLDAPALLERERRRDPAIVAISVVDSAGSILFHAGDPQAGAPAMLQQPAARDWLLREAGMVTLGARLSQRGAPAGTLLLRHAMDRQQATVALVARELTLAAVCAAILTALCFILGIDWLVRRMQRTVAGMDAALGREATPDGAPHAAALVGDVNVMAANALHDLAAARDTLAPLPAALPLAIE